MRYSMLLKKEWCYIVLLKQLKFDLSFQTEADVTEMESLQRYSSEVEGQDTTEQCHLEVLAHAVWVIELFLTMVIVVRYNTKYPRRLFILGCCVSTECCELTFRLFRLITSILYFIFSVGSLLKSTS